LRSSTPTQQIQNNPNGKYLEHENRIKGDAQRTLSPKSKYLEGIQVSQRDTGETRDIRILQGQLDLARSTIDTLKEELNVRSLAKCLLDNF